MGHQPWLRLAVILVFTVLVGGCASRQHYQLADLPLPLAPSEHCCWQAMQQLDIRYGERDIQLNAALARTAQGASLVLLDPVGRRMFSVSASATVGGGSTLDTWRSPELPMELPERFLLASSMLVWWPLAEWQSPGDGWSVTAENGQRHISYRNTPILTATYNPRVSLSVKNGIGAQSLGENWVELVHHRQPLRIRVKTIDWKTL